MCVHLRSVYIYMDMYKIMITVYTVLQPSLHFSEQHTLTILPCLSSVTPSHSTCYYEHFQTFREVQIVPCMPIYSRPRFYNWGHLFSLLFGSGSFLGLRLVLPTCHAVGMAGSRAHSCREQIPSGSAEPLFR